MSQLQDTALHLSTVTPILSLQSLLRWVKSSFGPRGKVAVFATSIRLREDAVNRDRIEIVSRITTTVDSRGSLRNLQGVNSDAHKFSDYLKMCNCPYYLKNMWLQDEYSDQGKNEMVQKIDRMFKESEQDVFLIYYTGHGSKTGDWVVPQELQSGQQVIESVSLDELLTIWEHRLSKNAQLIIIADSPHSGAWVKEIDKKDPRKINVSMISSCKDNEICTESSSGGHFTSFFLNNTKNEWKNSKFTPSYTKNMFCFTPQKRSADNALYDEDIHAVEPVIRSSSWEPLTPREPIVDQHGTETFLQKLLHKGPDVVCLCIFIVVVLILFFPIGILVCICCLLCHQFED